MAKPENEQLQEEKEDPEQPAGPCSLQRARACFLKGVSYFSGDMEVFGKWMESKFLKYIVTVKIHCPERGTD